MALEKHDWVAAKGPAGTPEVEAQAARTIDMEAALELIDQDPVLKRDEYASAVVRNEGIVRFKKTGEEVAVDLGNFLAARKAVLTLDKVKSVDELAVQIAEGGPDVADVLESQTLH